MNNVVTQHEIVAYVKDNPTVVLGTIGADGMPHGAAVYCIATSANQLYFVTKAETQKFTDITNNPHVSVTIVNTRENSSLQAMGTAEVEKNVRVTGMIMEKMTKIYAQSADWLPPIAKLRAGAYQIVGITLSQARLAKFKGERIGSQSIFKAAR